MFCPDYLSVIVCIYRTFNSKYIVAMLLEQKHISVELWNRYIRLQCKISIIATTILNMQN